MDPRPAFRYLADDDEGEQVPGGLNHLVPRNAVGTQWTWKEVTVVVDSGAAENVMPRSVFPVISHEETGTEKGSKDLEESTSRTVGKSCPSEPHKDSYARARGRSQA